MLGCCPRNCLAAGGTEGPNTDRALLHPKWLRRVMWLLVVRGVHMVGDEARVGRHRKGALGGHEWDEYKLQRTVLLDHT